VRDGYPVRDLGYEDNFAAGASVGQVLVGLGGLGHVQDLVHN